jgi:hypothetical protein
MKPLPLLLALLLVAPPPVRAALEIKGELKIKPHRMAVLTAANAPDGAALIWDYDEAALHGEESGGRLFLAGPPGAYRVKLRAITLKDSKTTAETARAEVVFDGPAIPVPPAPVPPTTPPPAPKPTPMEALCRFRTGRIGCTATIIGPRRPDGRWDVLCASHCLGVASMKGTITLKDGRTLKVTVTEREKSSDLAWMVTDEKFDSLPFALLAEKAPPVGAAIWHAGFGVDKPGNVEKGTVAGAVTAQGQLPMTLSVSSGDSGGGIFLESTGELVAAVCCTSAMARRARVFGGSSVRAIALRPKAAMMFHPYLDLLEADEWTRRNWLP